MIVTFCGHSRVPYENQVETWLTEVVSQLIEEGATHFYLGGYGDFDGIAFRVVRKRKRIHPQIQIIYVMAYLDRPPQDADRYDGTTYPPIELGPPRFAISRRNKWLAEVADVVVSYIRYEDSGGAAAMWKHAKRHKKRIIRCPSFDSKPGGILP